MSILIGKKYPKCETRNIMKHVEECTFKRKKLKRNTIEHKSLSLKNLHLTFGKKTPSRAIIRIFRLLDNFAEAQFLFEKKNIKCGYVHAYY